MIKDLRHRGTRAGFSSGWWRQSCSSRPSCGRRAAHRANLASPVSIRHAETAPDSKDLFVAWRNGHRLCRSGPWSRDASSSVQAVMGVAHDASRVCMVRLFKKGASSRTASVRRRINSNAFWSGGDLTALYSQHRDQRPGRNRRATHLRVRFVRASSAAFASSGTPIGSTALGRAPPMRVAQIAKGIGSNANLAMLATVVPRARTLACSARWWCIMMAFPIFGMCSRRRLAAVAPGIAEALVATRSDCSRRFPAVIAYNHRFADRSAAWNCASTPS